MAELSDDAPAAPGKSLKIPLIIGLALAILGGGGGFYATHSGLILGEAEGTAVPVPSALPDIVFVPIEPMLINLGAGANSRHLRFKSELEVARVHQPDVQKVLPRIQDVLNSYLRAVEMDDLENPAALVRLRAQMLRRIQIVTGEGRVRDLLITEFVLN